MRRAGLRSGPRFRLSRDREESFDVQR